MRKRFLIACAVLAVVGSVAAWSAGRFYLWSQVGGAVLQRGPGPTLPLNSLESMERLKPRPPGSMKQPFNGTYYYVVPLASL